MAIDQLAIIFLHGEGHCHAVMTTDSQTVVGTGADEAQALLSLLDSSGIPLGLKRRYLANYRRQTKK